MKTDKLFYRLFLSRPSLISELIPEIPLGSEFTYSAPAIKEKGFAIDGLLTPIGDDPSLPIVFLEAQMQRDSQFYLNPSSKAQTQKKNIGGDWIW